MSASQQMKELAERRHLLVVEAEIHRSLIVLERESLRTRLAGLQAARQRVTAGGPLLVAGGAIAGLLTFRHWRKLLHWAPTALTALRWVQSLKGR